MITVYSKDVMCDTIEDLKNLITQERFAQLQIDKQIAGGYRVEITY